MTNPFIETKKVIKEKTNASGPGYCYMSVVPQVNGQLSIVIGARYEYNQSSGFSKKTLGQLIEQLSQIHEVMED